MTNQLNTAAAAAAAPTSPSFVVFHRPFGGGWSSWAYEDAERAAKAEAPEVVDYIRNTPAEARTVEGMRAALEAYRAADPDGDEWGPFSLRTVQELDVCEVPAGRTYHIEELDGRETVRISTEQGPDQAELDRVAQVSPSADFWKAPDQAELAAHRVEDAEASLQRLAAGESHHGQPVAIFLQGLPAAGKSTCTAGTFDSWHVIDPDAVKASHPDYDPKNPSALHEWSKQVTNADTRRRCAGRQSFVADGTGTKAAPMLAHIARAKAEGFFVALVYVSCTLETSLRRNARRERVVPEEVIREKAAQIVTAHAAVAAEVHGVFVIDNDEDARDVVGFACTKLDTAQRAGLDAMTNAQQVRVFFDDCESFAAGITDGDDMFEKLMALDAATPPDGDQEQGPEDEPTPPAGALLPIGEEVGWAPDVLGLFGPNKDQGERLAVAGYILDVATGRTGYALRNAEGETLRGGTTEDEDGTGYPPQWVA
jgi:predicted kinase